MDCIKHGAPEDKCDGPVGGLVPTFAWHKSLATTLWIGETIRGASTSQGLNAAAGRQAK